MSSAREPVGETAADVSAANDSWGGRSAPQGALQERLSRASAGDFPLILQELMRKVPSQMRDREMMEIFEAWGSRDARMALLEAGKINDPNMKDDLLSAIVSGWVLKQPEAAFAWALSQPGSARFAGDAIARLAQEDPQRALKLVNNSPRPIDESIAEQVYGAIIRAPLEQGKYDEAKKIIDSVENRMLRKQLISDLASTWGRYQPQQAAQWLIAQPEGAEREDAFGNLAYTWAQKDATAAANFAASLPAGPSRRQALVNAVVVWAERDVVAASNWLDRFDPHPDNDSAVAAIATSTQVVNQNPDVALSWAESIVNPEQRVESINMIAFQWSQKNPAAARQFIQTTPLLTPAQRADLLQSLASNVPSE